MGVCDAQDCTASVVIAWATEGVNPSDPEPVPPSLEHEPSPSPATLLPFVTSLDLPPGGQGFECTGGPGGPAREVPAFVSVEKVEVLDTKHPRTRTDVEGVRITSGQNLVAGSIIYRIPAIAFAAFSEGGELDESGPFPLRDHDRIVYFWSNGDTRFDKGEIRFDGQRWDSVEPSFTVALDHAAVTFYPDASAFPASPANGGIRAGDFCDGEGFAPLGSPGSSGRSETEDPVSGKSGAALVGVLVLLVMASLSWAVVKSGRPPSGAISVAKPSAPIVRLERSDVSYDRFGRPTGLVDIIELPDGSTRTIRVHVSQEALLVDSADFLDVGDWEDEVVLIERREVRKGPSGRILSFVEDTTARDGTVHRSTVDAIAYDDLGRVVSYTRSTHLMADESPDPSRTRFESVTLRHEDVPQSTLTDQGDLQLHERVERTDMRYDAEGHVSGFVATIHTQGMDAVSRPLYDLGLGFPDVPIAQSGPNRGFVRVRNVLTSWFRKHACHVRLHITDPAGDPMSRALVRFGEDEVRTDHAGRVLLWVLEPGDYSVSVGGVLAGWVRVSHLPGVANASFSAAQVVMAPSYDLG